MKLYCYMRARDIMTCYQRNEIVPTPLQPGIDSKHAVWATSREVWNPDSYLLDVDEKGIIWTTNTSSLDAAVTLGRIQLDPDWGFMDLKTFQQIGGVHPEFVEAAVQEAHQVGIDPSCWRFSLEPIPASRWHSIESYEGGGWRDLYDYWFPDGDPTL